MIGKEMQPQNTKRSGIRLRCFLIGIGLIPINGYWVMQQQVVLYAWPSYVVPFSNVIFSLFFLILFHIVPKRLLARPILTQGEFLIIYIMLSLSSALLTFNMMGQLIPEMGHAFWFATPENEWEDLFWRYIPRWLAVDDPSALRNYYQGNSNFFTFDHFEAWIVPICCWTLFTFMLVFTMLCINVIFRRQWVENEKLIYPIIQLPAEMTNPTYRFFKSRFMWIGFSISGVILIFNILNFHYPMIPGIPVKVRFISQLFTEKPWNAIGNLRISFYPFIIGLGFLMPLDLSFSCWFFYLFNRLLLVLFSATNLYTIPRFPFFDEQAFGAYMALVTLTIWMSRGHLKRVLGAILDCSSSYDAQEPMSYRKAFLGMIIGMLFIILFSMKAGMSFWVCVLFFAIYFVLSIAITWMRAALGFPIHSLMNVGADYRMISSIGTRYLNPGSLMVISLYRWLNRGYESHPMPHQLEGFKLTAMTHTDSRKLPFAMMLSTLSGIVIVFILFPYAYYKFGALSPSLSYSTDYYGAEPFTQLQWRLSYPTQPNYLNTSLKGIGFAFASFLMLMRTRFVWWPLHPLGYALSNGWAMAQLWSCMVLSSLAKWAILKFGGLKLYRKARLFFLGAILGDFIIGNFWLTVVGLCFGKPTYIFWQGGI